MYLLEIYATDDGNAETGGDIMNYKQLRNMSIVRHSETLSENDLIWGRVSEESRLKGVFIKGSHN